ncbi:MAG: DUF6089 family protein [Cyclobacteriaceae bacterium]|nr:DUF6089 family protein [Cyclobacteriaceae bacterium]
MRFYLFLLLLSGIQFTNAQLIEFGIGPGTLNYAGDLVKGVQLANSSPAVQVHHRMNLSKVVSVRWALTYGKIKGSDTYSNDPFGLQRNGSFNLNIAELSSTFEYHFLDYKHDKSHVRWSPYAFFGIGFTRLYKAPGTYGDYNPTQAIIPYGIGFKQLIGRRFSSGIEFGVRQTFFDYLDTYADGDQTVKDFQYGNPADRDVYYFVGISLSYIVYKIPCPFPYVPNRYMLRTYFR